MSSSLAGKSGGWCPREACKGDMPVVQLVRQLWADSILGKCMLQEVGLLAATQHMAASRSGL